MGKRGSAHIRAERDARIRDRCTCQICGSTAHTEAHHSVDFQFGGSASPDKMVTLCRPCHKDVHRGKIDIFVL